MGAGIGLALLAVAALLVVRRSFPQVDGEIMLPGLTAEATVIRDRHGTPHIYASTLSDLVMAQGFVEAQDRFWQMDFYRHVAAGRTAEMFGEAQVEADIFLRTLGWERVAAREYQALSPLMRTLLDAYAQGVNAYLAGRGEWETSLEYAFLGIQNPDYRPAAWKPTDTLAFAKVVAWDLRTNIVSEIERAVLSESIPTEWVSQLWPDYPDDHPVIVPGWDRNRRHLRSRPALPCLPRRFGKPPTPWEKLGSFPLAPAASGWSGTTGAEAPTPGWCRAATPCPGRLSWPTIPTWGARPPPSGTAWVSTASR